MGVNGVSVTKTKQIGSRINTFQSIKCPNIDIKVNLSKNLNKRHTVIFLFLSATVCWTRSRTFIQEILGSIPDRGTTK